MERVFGHKELEGHTTLVDGTAIGPKTTLSNLLFTSPNVFGIHFGKNYEAIFEDVKLRRTQEGLMQKITRQKEAQKG